MTTDEATRTYREAKVARPPTRHITPHDWGKTPRQRTWTRHGDRLTFDGAFRIYVYPGEE